MFRGRSPSEFEDNTPPGWVHFSMRHWRWSAIPVCILLLWLISPTNDGAEMQQKLSRSIADLVSLAAGGIVVMIGALAVTTAIVLLLVNPVGLDPWLAALLVGGILAIAGFVMLRGGLRNLKMVDPAPRRTIENLKEDIQMVKERRP